MVSLGDLGGLGDLVSLNGELGRPGRLVSLTWRGADSTCRYAAAGPPSPPQPFLNFFAPCFATQPPAKATFLDHILHKVAFCCYADLTLLLRQRSLLVIQI